MRCASRCWALAAVAAFCVFAASAAPAQTFPSKRVTIIQPYPPGGGGDAAARALAQELSEQWGQPVIVESKPGAGTTISAAYVAKMPADGYTLLMSTTQLASAGALFKGLTYDWLKDFAPISLFGESPFILIAKPELNVGTVDELIAIARTRTLNYGSSGVAGIPHLAAAALNKAHGLTAVHVPFQGTAPAFAAILGNQVDYLFGDVSVVPHVQSRKVRALAVTAPKRMAVLPDVPAMTERDPDFKFTIWIALEAPAGTPKGVIDTINAAVKRATASPRLVKLYGNAGREPKWSTPGQLAAFKVSEVEKYSSLIRETGAKLD